MPTSFCPYAKAEPSPTPCIRLMGFNSGPVSLGGFFPISNLSLCFCKCFWSHLVSSLGPR